ncbi:AI-2E family transporter [Lacunimicrobium album]
MIVNGDQPAMFSRAEPVRPLWVVLFVMLIMAATGVLKLTLTFLLLTFGSILFGVFLHGLGKWLSELTGWSYRTASIVVLLTLLVTIFGGAYLMGARVVDQLSTLWSQIETSFAKLEEWVSGYEWAREYIPKKDQMKDMVQNEKMASWLASGASRIGSTMGQFGTIIGGGILMFVVGAYLALESKIYRDGMVKLLPKERRAKGGEVISRLNETLTNWIRGQLISMSIIGVSTMIGLWLMGVPMAITLGVIAALCTFIPNVGPFLAAIPQSLVAVQLGGMAVVYVIIFNVALQTFESYLITPVVQKQQANLPPAMTIMFQLLMTLYFGILGGLLGAPLLAVLIVLVQALYVEELEKEPDTGVVMNV